MKRLEDSTQYSRFFILVLNHPPGEQADGRVEIVAIAEQLRANLRRKIGSRRLSAQKIDDLMLLLLGDEDYLRLPGNEFENLPDVLTEDAALHAEYADALYGCLGLIDELYTYAFLANDTVLVDLIDELSIDDENNLPLTGPEGLQQFTERQVAVVRRIGQTLRLTFAERMYLTVAFQVCRDTYSVERDEFLATEMQSRLPEGRGLIFRGTAHRQPLINAFNALCSGEGPGAVGSDDGAVDPTLQEGSE